MNGLAKAEYKAAEYKIFSINKYHFEFRQEKGSDATSVKCLGTVNDSKSKFDEAMNQKFHRMAYGTKKLSTLNESSPEKAKINLLSFCFGEVAKNLNHSVFHHIGKTFELRF